MINRTLFGCCVAIYRELTKAAEAEETGLKKAVRLPILQDFSWHPLGQHVTLCILCACSVPISLWCVRVCVAMVTIGVFVCTTQRQVRALLPLWVAVVDRIRCLRALQRVASRAAGCPWQAARVYRNGWQSKGGDGPENRRAQTEVRLPAVQMCL